MIKSANEKKVKLYDLRKADDEIRSSTWWNDLIDLPETFSKIRGVNTHVVSVEEKRRGIEEAGS